MVPEVKIRLIDWPVSDFVKHLFVMYTSLAMTDWWSLEVLYSTIDTWVPSIWCKRHL